ncbi:MAG TPA: CehA/McbA family metallohydrolase [bacterium]|nr:CehA/McbA family metallohydrolase [bacterium]
MNLKRILAATFLSIVILATRLVAYPELHMQPGMYPKKQPDIIADTATRSEHTGEIPILLMIRHSNIFPVILKSVTITANLDNGDPPVVKNIYYDNLKLKQLMWHDTRSIEIPDTFHGMAEIDVEFDITLRSGNKKIINNNCRNMKGIPLKVFVGAPPLPRFDNWHYGDSHHHTLYTENAYEFGAPAAFSAAMAHRMGLDWITFTDHSFDLDDIEGNSETNDPDLKRWKQQLGEIESLQKQYPDMLFVPGEELSCGNAQAQNVHMLVFNPKKFYVGNGDGYENGNTPDLACADVCAQLAPAEAAFAAHPVTEVSSIELYLINRGVWSLHDATVPGLSGLESWNHDRTPNKESMQLWTQALLAGHTTFLLAGTDAHGDFSRELAYYPDGLPYGAIRSAIYMEGKPTIPKLIESLKSGRIVTTSGPLAIIETMNTEGVITGVSGTTTGGPFLATVKAASTPEFGPITEVKFIIGDLDKKKETLFAAYKTFADPYQIEEIVKLTPAVKRGYIRAEVGSDTGTEKFEAYTNPIWFEW